MFLSRSYIASTGLLISKLTHLTFSSSKLLSTKADTTFKYLSLNFASEEQIKKFEQEKNSKNKKVIKNKLSKRHITKSSKVPKNEALLPKELTFGAVLERSSIASDVNKLEIEAKQFLKKSAKLLVEKMGDFDLASNEISEFLKKSDELFPIEKADEEVLEKMSLNKPTFCVASIINDSPTLQKLVDLGVDLSYWEKIRKGDIAMSLDFESNIVPRIRFLIDLGIRAQDIGEIFTINPTFFMVDLDDVKVRLQYLESKNFTKKMITQIVTLSHARWLNMPVVEIDARLGFLQKTFKLKGNEVRSLAVSEPNLVIWRGTPHQVSLNKMKIVEGMGFTEEEAKAILFNCPLVYKCKFEDKLQTNFEVLHEKVGLPHELLVKFSSVLLASRYTVKHRHDFLVMLGRNQYDPRLPNYVSPIALAETTDEEFCLNVAKVPVETMNKYLKTI